MAVRDVLSLPVHSERLYDGIRQRFVNDLEVTEQSTTH